MRVCVYYDSFGCSTCMWNLWALGERILKVGRQTPCVVVTIIGQDVVDFSEYPWLKRSLRTQLP